MKIGLITDLHMGRYKGDYDFLQSQLLFLDEFVERVNNSDVDKVIIPGDVWDNRNTISIYVFNIITDHFFKKLKKPTDIILGNHDMYHLENEDINLVQYLRDINPLITFVDKIKVVKEDGKKFMMVPFLYNKQKIKEFKDAMKREVRIDYIFGHFEIDKAFPGCTLKLNIFEKYTKRVISGHYHINSQFKYKNLKFDYIGSPYELDRGDRDSYKGYHILDTDTGLIESVENKVSIRFKDIYLEDIIDGNITEEDVEGNIVSVIIKTSTYESLGKNSIFRNIAVNNYINDINDMKPYKIKRKTENDKIKSIINKKKKDEKIKFYDIEDLFDIFMDEDKNIPVGVSVLNIKKMLKEEIKDLGGL